LLFRERRGDRFGRMAATKCSVERQNREIDPFIQIVGSSLDLDQLLANMVEDASGTWPRAEGGERTDAAGANIERGSFWFLLSGR
jgi:hypothetical protein